MWTPLKSRALVFGFQYSVGASAQQRLHGDSQEILLQVWLNTLPADACHALCLSIVYNDMGSADDRHALDMIGC